MKGLTRIMRMAMVPAFAVVVALAVGGSASAQDMMGNDMMGNDMMSSAPAMVPMAPGSNEMMSVTLRMPMDMGTGMMMMDQPTVRQIQGVGYEIDFGGPSILIE